MTIWVLTGNVGGGKTTALKRVVTSLARKGLKMAGVLSLSVFDERGDRIGYDHVIFESDKGKLIILGEAPFLRKGASPAKTGHVKSHRTPGSKASPRVPGSKSFHLFQIKKWTGREKASSQAYRDSVGPYRINGRVLRSTASYLAGRARKGDLDLLVIDEIGHLELKGDGFYGLLGEAVERRVSLLLVIRRELLGKALALPPLRKEKKHIFCVEREKPNEMAREIGG